MIQVEHDLLLTPSVGDWVGPLVGSEVAITGAFVGDVVGSRSAVTGDCVGLEVGWLDGCDDGSEVYRN